MLSSFQGPLEIDRMLSPREILRIDGAKAFLFCAVTPVRRASVDAVQNDAERNSFSQGFRTTDTDFSRLWRGLEQTALIVKARLVENGIMRREQKDISSGFEGTHTLMRRTILVKPNLCKTV